MKSSKEKQDQRKAELQAAALRDGFGTWSQAITAWKNGEARLTKVAADGGKAAAQKVNPRFKGCGQTPPPLNQTVRQLKQ